MAQTDTAFLINPKAHLDLITLQLLVFQRDKTKATDLGGLLSPSNTVSVCHLPISAYIPYQTPLRATRQQIAITIIVLRDLLRSLRGGLSQYLLRSKDPKIHVKIVYCELGKEMFMDCSRGSSTNTLANSLSASL